MLLLSALLPLTESYGEEIKGAVSSSDSSTLNDQDSSGMAATENTPKKKKNDLTDTVHYESDYIRYDAEEKTLHLIGKANVRYQKMRLTADTIIYTIEDNLFTATGSPQLIEGTDTTVGDYMAYNLKTRRGRVRYASTHLDDGYFTGQRIVKTAKNELYVDQGDYTTCAHVDSPDFYFYGKNIKLIPNDKIISRPVVLNIGDAPVAVLPFFMFPIERKRRSGFLTPAWGGSPTGGGYVDNVGYYYAPNDYMDFTAKGKVYDFKEFVLEGSSNYVIKYLLNGRISGRYAYASGFENESNQWAINYSHNQNLTPDAKTRLSGSGSLASSKKVFNFSEDDDEILNQQISANLSLSRTFERINGSGSINWRRDHNLSTEVITEDLPSFTFNLPSRPLLPQPEGASKDSARWYNKIYLGYNAHGNIQHDMDTLTETFRPGLTQSVTLSSPQTLFKHITLNPSLSARLSIVNDFMDTTINGYDTLFDTLSYTLRPPFKDSYSDEINPVIERDTITYDSYGVPDSIRVKRLAKKVVEDRNTYKDSLAYDADWSAGVNLSTNLYGTFPIRIFNFAGFRHTFSPNIGYKYVPKHNQDKMSYNLRGIPFARGREDQQQLLTLSIGNQFDGKFIRPGKEGEKPKEEKFSIMSVNLSTSYDFEKDSLKWSDLNLSASTSIKSLGIRYNSTFWLYDQHNNLSFPIMRSMDLNLSMGSLGAKGSLSGGDLLVLDSLHPHDPIKYHNAGPQSWSVSVSPTYSFRMSRTSPTEMFVPTKHFALSASASMNFSPNWSVRWRGNYNFIEDQWVQNSISLYCDLECWDMRFEWRPEKLNPGYYFLINIKKIPEIKWEKRN